MNDILAPLGGFMVLLGELELSALGALSSLGLSGVFLKEGGILGDG